MGERPGQVNNASGNVPRRQERKTLECLTTHHDRRKSGDPKPKHQRGGRLARPLPRAIASRRWVRKVCPSVATTRVALATHWGTRPNDKRDEVSKPEKQVGRPLKKGAPSTHAAIPIKTSCGPTHLDEARPTQRMCDAQVCLKAYARHARATADVTTNSTTHTHTYTNKRHLERCPTIAISRHEGVGAPQQPLATAPRGHRMGSPPLVSERPQRRCKEGAGIATSLPTIRQCMPADRCIPDCMGNLASKCCRCHRPWARCP